MEAWSATTIAETVADVGQIYTVRQYTDQNGRRSYLYAYYTTESLKGVDHQDLVNLYGNLSPSVKPTGNTEDDQATVSYRNQDKNATLVYNSRDGLYYRMNADDSDVVYVQLDMNDYKSPYRYASTPWIVSNLKGDMNHVDVTKLFRFHTISDGDSSNYDVKVSIENIKPDEGTFDVVVRRIDDADESISVLERFGKCSMVPGDSNYIAYRIGSFDGTYEVKSKYITVEVNESTASRTSVPCGFLGYPIPKYDGTAIVNDEENWNPQVPETSVMVILY